MSRNKKRYVVVIDTYVYAENDYMARKKAHKIKNECSGNETKVIEIYEQSPRSTSVKNRELSDISEPASKNYWTEEDELPF